LPNGIFRLTDHSSAVSVVVPPRNVQLHDLGLSAIREVLPSRRDSENRVNQIAHLVIRTARIDGDARPERK
jgi:hypothetical protein